MTDRRELVDLCLFFVERVKRENREVEGSKAVGAERRRLRTGLLQHLSETAALVGVVRGVAATKVLAWWWWRWRCDDASTTAKTTERRWVSGSPKMKKWERGEWYP